jgi:hypothetical protein
MAGLLLHMIRSIIILCLIGTIAASHGHDHHRISERHVHLHARNGTNSPEDLVAQALRVLAGRNKARVENPKFNKLEVVTLDKEPELAPPIFIDNTLNGTVLRRQASNETSPVNGTSASDAYSIPPELAEAARQLAEASPQTPEGNQADVAATTRAKYAPSTNDTNVPQSLKTPEGKLSAWAPDFVANASQLDRRDYGYWMADMPKRGRSPFAPNGYQVR